MDTPNLKANLLRLIGAAIDEASVPNVENSFVEMDERVIHYAGDGGERYFRVVLVETTEDEYFKSIEPSEL